MRWPPPVLAPFMVAAVSETGGGGGGSPPGDHGPFHRTGTTQDDETTKRQLESGELWGRPDRGSDRPSVDAWHGELPEDTHGVEFWTDVPPDPGQPPGRARWSGRRPGVRVDDEWAKIRGRITKWRLQE
jgi:hypothetical protein